MKLHILLLLPLIVSFAIAGEGTSANYVILTESADHGGKRTTSANYTQDGSAGSISGTSSDGSGTVVTKSGYVAQLDSDALVVLSVVSRKVHGGSGTFDIDLPLTGTSGIECRSGGAGGNHQVIVTFASPVSVSGISVMSIDGQATGTRSVNGSAVTVDLSAVANAQTIGITLTGVNNGATTGDVFVPMGVLVGDTTDNGFVNAGDALQTRNRSGQATDATNFRSDVNADGLINSGDTTVVRSRSGSFIP